MDNQGIFKYALMSYLPQKYLRHASFEAQEADRLIIDFKSGRKYATERVSRLFAKSLALMDLKDTIIVCIPASCQQTYTRRFRKFSHCDYKNTLTLIDITLLPVCHSRNIVRMIRIFSP